MPNTLRIKRRASTGALGAPSSLANAELAYNEADNTLYYGKGTGGAGGTASQIDAIAGPGAYTTLGTTQTVTGIKTFSGPCVFSGTGTNSATGVTQASSDDSTRLATTAYVKSVVSAAGGGTVNSVGLSLPNLFTVTGSPVTGSGTLTATLATQVANRVFAGPGTGADAAPTFRALVADDIPALSTDKLTSGTLPIARGGTGITSLGTGIATFLGTPSSANLAAAVTDETGTGALVFSASPTLTGTVNAENLTLSGNLTVNGTTTTINSTTVTIDDKNFVLGDVASPTDAGADGGGITLKGTTDKTFNWVDATDAWTSSEHLNLLTGKAFYINGTSVLSSNTLGSGVTTSSLTSVGTITTGTWSATAIAATRGGTGLTTVPKGAVLVANTVDTISALDGGGSVDGILAYDAATDTISWATTIDGGTF
jgi:hypothetical protein